MPGWKVDVHAKQIDFPAVSLGVMSPGVERFFGGEQGPPPPGDGAQVAYAKTRFPCSMIQYLAGDDGQPRTADDPVLEAGATYTLSVAVGRGRNFKRTGADGTEAVYNDIFAGFEIALLAGGEVMASTNAPVPPPGTLENCTVTFTAKEDDPRLGQPLSVRLSVPGVENAPAGHTFFDNVRVTMTRTGREG